ncbi:MAG: hypothetical protein ABI035_09405 [Gemmatimonadaceae bacterium]
MWLSTAQCARDADRDRFARSAAALLTGPPRFALFIGDILAAIDVTYRRAAVAQACFEMLLRTKMRAVFAAKHQRSMDTW